MTETLTAGHLLRPDTSSATALEAFIESLTTLLTSKGASDITVIDLHGKSYMADAIVIASGTSSRHVSSMADYVVELMGDSALSVEGKTEGEWVLIDHPEVVVHLFKPDIREHYGLERMWGDEIGNEQDEVVEVELVH